MLEDRQNIDDIFSDALGNYQEDAPNYSWNNIQEDLNKLRRKRRIRAVRNTGIFFAALAVFLLGYWTSTFDLYQKSEAFYIRTISKNKMHKYRNRAKDSSKLKVANVETTKINKEKTNSNRLLAALSKSNRKQSANNNTSGKTRDKSVSNTLRENKTKDKQDKKYDQLLTKTLLSQEESRQDDGSLLSDNTKVVYNWSLGAQFSPVYSINPFNAHSGSNNYQRSSESRLSEVSSEILSAYTGGINVNYRLSKRFSIESGLFYSKSKQLSKMRGIMSSSFAADEAVDGEIGDVISPSAAVGSYRYATLQYTQDLDYLELPFSIRYRLIDRKFGLDLSGGMSTNFLVRNSIRSQTDINSLQFRTNSMLYNAKLSLGLNYRVREKVMFNLEPTLRYSINSNSFLNNYPYSFAVFAGFIYKIK